eukprot:TRINITY_DN3095_c0_g1_i1.p7 TRINITY_DN3095_c0_g1~~TRINITY_DN3095_c0_g1_i1.p7  ORF type:complete len:225 (-),score=56.29 TRINITY_DN3095_c0_g1_i1:1151-1825(-)
MSPEKAKEQRIQSLIQQKDAAEARCKGCLVKANLIELEESNEKLQTELEKEKTKVLELTYKYSTKMSAPESLQDEKLTKTVSVGPGIDEIPKPREYKAELAQLKKYVLKLEKENEKLKEALIQEQNEKIARTKDSIELEERLKIVEKQMEESSDSRIKLTKEIAALQGSYSKILKKMKETEEIYEMCANFLQQNGILASSFLSASDNIFQQYIYEVQQQSYSSQ